MTELKSPGSQAFDLELKNHADSQVWGLVLSHITSIFESLVCSHYGFPDSLIAETSPFNHMYTYILLVPPLENLI